MNRFDKLCGLGTDSRYAEMAFAGGIPICGFLIAAQSPSMALLGPAIWMLVLTAMVGAHILIMNDICFPGKATGRGAILPASIVLLLALGFAVGNGFIGAAGCLALMAINWNIYSRWSKGCWPMSLLHHGVGGSLHFIVGALFAAVAVNTLWPYILYFTLMMIGASMHHDAVHVDEDSAVGIETGAVRFGAMMWWRAAVIPIACAHVSLWMTTGVFRVCMFAALFAYVALYGMFWRGPWTAVRLRRFRFLCRAVYGLAGGGYVLIYWLSV